MAIQNQLINLLACNGCLPDKATISSAVNPFFLKAAIRPSRSRNGEGKSELAALKSAVVESRLPKRTSQLGPPS